MLAKLIISFHPIQSHHLLAVYRFLSVLQLVLIDGNTIGCVTFVCWFAHLDGAHVWNENLDPVSSISRFSHNCILMFQYFSITKKINKIFYINCGNTGNNVFDKYLILFAGLLVVEEKVNFLMDRLELSLFFNFVFEFLLVMEFNRFWVNFDVGLMKRFQSNVNRFKIKSQVCSSTKKTLNRFKMKAKFTADSQQESVPF